jgi:hypothetical protein
VGEMMCRENENLNHQFDEKSSFGQLYILDSIPPMAFEKRKKDLARMLEVSPRCVNQRNCVWMGNDVSWTKSVFAAIHLLCPFLSQFSIA